MSDEAALTLAEEPTLRFRQMHQELHAFAHQTMDEDDVPAYTSAMLASASALLSPVAFPAASTTERAALQANKIKVAGKNVDVSPVIQQEIIKLSDEFHVSERACFEFWWLASDAQRREWVERVDQLPAGSITGSIPAAARHLLISETEYKLHLLKELLRLRFEETMDLKRRQFILSCKCTAQWPMVLTSNSLFWCTL